jgi:hypothetical protein
MEIFTVGEPKMSGFQMGEAIYEIGGTAEGDRKASFYHIDIFPVCIPDRNEGIPVPKAWPIDSGVLEGSYLFVFHLLPQKATRKYNQDELMTDKPSEQNPKCMKDDGLSFKFVSFLINDFMAFISRRVSLFSI